MLLAAAHVLVHAGYAFDDRLAAGTVDHQYAALLAAIGACNHFDGITTAN
jgi:hypothetical protein